MPQEAAEGGADVGTRCGGGLAREVGGVSEQEGGRGDGGDGEDGGEDTEVRTPALGLDEPGGDGEEDSAGEAGEEGDDHHGAGTAGGVGTAEPAGDDGEGWVIEGAGHGDADGGPEEMEERDGLQPGPDEREG